MWSDPVRSAFVLVVLLFPTALADHSVGHAVIPGGEVVDALGAHASQIFGHDWSNVSTVDGSCEHRINMSGRYVLGISVPDGIEEAHVECQVAGSTIVTPDPFHP